MSSITIHQHAHHFYDSEQQASSAKLGMWLFLVTEVLLFSGLFVAYTVVKTLHPEMWKIVTGTIKKFRRKAKWIDRSIRLNTSRTMLDSDIQDFLLSPDKYDAAFAAANRKAWQKIKSAKPRTSRGKK